MKLLNKHYEGYLGQNPLIPPTPTPPPLSENPPRAPHKKIEMQSSERENIEDFSPVGFLQF